MSGTTALRPWATVGVCLCVALAGCAPGGEHVRALAERPSSTGGRPDPCSLLASADIQRIIGHPLLPARHSDSTGRACDWTASDAASSGASPGPVITPGPATGSSYRPPVYPGVSVLIADNDWASLRGEIGHPNGQETARAVPGVGDEAIMLAIGSDWRHLSVRKGSVSFEIVVSLTANHGPADVEHAEQALAALAVTKLLP
jgi:hypothetical protein